MLIAMYLYYCSQNSSKWCTEEGSWEAQGCNWRNNDAHWYLQSGNAPHFVPYIFVLFTATWPPKHWNATISSIPVEHVNTSSAYACCSPLTCLLRYVAAGSYWPVAGAWYQWQRLPYDEAWKHLHFCKWKQQQILMQSFPTFTCPYLLDCS